MFKQTEFSKAYYELRDITQNKNVFLDGLIVSDYIEDEPMYVCDIDVPYVRINRYYCLCLYDDYSGKAYIQTVIGDN